MTAADRQHPTHVSQSGAKRFLSNPMTWIVLAGCIILWFSTGAQPLGFPKGEYVCEARSGVAGNPVSVFHVGGGRINVIEYEANSSTPVENGVTYGHGMFNRYLNLNIYEASYYCELR